MKDIVWKLFEETGNPAYYRLYRELSNGRNDKSGGAESHRLQRKR
ncbi:unknown [Corallococcus sp. CAG:1435]|nr:unknown [Corallococcus sp. CAG:1435]